MITRNLRHSGSDLPPEVMGSHHVFKRLGDARRALTFNVDETKLSKAGADVETRRATLRDLQERKAALEQSREPLREEFQHLATLNALGESATADVDKVRSQLSALEKELRSLEDSDAAIVGEIELATNVLNELQNRKAAAIEAERQRVLQVESEAIRRNLATMLEQARELDALTFDTALRFQEVAWAGLARTSVNEFPTFEAIIHAFFNRYEAKLPPEGGQNG